MLISILSISFSAIILIIEQMTEVLTRFGYGQEREVLVVLPSQVHRSSERLHLKIEDALCVRMWLHGARLLHGHEVFARVNRADAIQESRIGIIHQVTSLPKHM